MRGPMKPTWGALASTTAISVATVLGTGILALPVTLHRSGLGPFVASFTVTLIAQLGVIVAMTELLQHAYAMAPKGQMVRKDEYAAIVDGAFSMRDDNEDEEWAMEDERRVEGQAASLHTLSKLYLNHRLLQWLFETFVLLHFVSIMVSYALGAPQVYRQLVPMFGRMSETRCIAIFTVVASVMIVSFSKKLFGFLTVATCMKGTLLTVLIVMTLGVGFGVGLKPHSDWGISAVESFLVGCLALSGTVNLMPVTFEACVRSSRGARGRCVSEKFVSQYRGATMLGVFICYVLNVGWCVACLFIVPQADLRAANVAGENSTYSLIETLRQLGGSAEVVAFLVNVFTAVSVTVSFFVMGLGMKHTLDSQLKAYLSSRTDSRTRAAMSISYYAMWFGAILLLALLNPHSLIKVLAGVTSFSLNVEAGIFIIYMLVQTRRPYWNHAVLETSLSDITVTFLSMAVGGYFCIAVLVDLVLYLFR